MIARARFSDAEGRRRARETWEKHLALVNRAGNVETYLKGAVPRREQEGKAQARADRDRDWSKRMRNGGNNG